MGYYTYFELEVTKLENAAKPTLTLDEVIKKGESGELTQAQMLKALKLIKKGATTQEVTSDEIIEDLRNTNESAAYALDESGGSSDHCKWYDHTIEMSIFSQKYPSWLFTLSGKGEETGDLWKEYYYNGRVQKAPAEVTYAAFDIKKLQNP